ncbi:MAG TPA: hypothetical protein DEB39_00865, partial [Planctomycetaceae bacterium]|nr:hypothetical protein [Planctomycetaceae bacterium]
MFTHFFIKRPIFSTVISLIITLLGVVSYFKLPVTQYPDIVPPSVSIQATYPGAYVEDIVNAVAIPIEQQVNGVDNMIYMSTACTSTGEVTIRVTFSVGTDPDIATVLVQNRVKLAEPFLPEEVRLQGINVKKMATNFIMFAGVLDVTGKKNDVAALTGGTGAEDAVAKDAVAGAAKEINARQDEQADEQAMAAAIDFEQHRNRTATREDLELEIARQESEERSTIYIANFTKLYIQDVFARVEGVGEVMVFNREDFSMRIWLDPDIMAARGISVSEVNAMILEQNQQITAGRVGLPPVPVGQKSNLSLVTLGRLEDVKQFEDMILRVDDQGRIMRLKDVATIELGALNYGSIPRYNGQPVTMMAITQRPGANSLDVAKNVREQMDELRPSLARSGLDFIVGYDATEYVRISIDEVQKTLLECILFVVLTVYIFLQDWRAALIPILTIPVSLIGCFFFMTLFGFSLNTLTLFGLVLVIGIVVDDAIVVVENTQRIIDEEGLEPFEATKLSMIQVASPVLATALVLMAVFIPAAMMAGIVGQLYKQFALTIAASVGISGLCALTLSPAMCAIFLRPSIAKHQRRAWFRAFNWAFDLFTACYVFVLRRLIHGSAAMLALWFLLVAGLIVAFVGLPGTPWPGMPTGFLPDEDQGACFCDVRLPEGASTERTLEVMIKAEQMMREATTLPKPKPGLVAGLVAKVKSLWSPPAPGEAEETEELLEDLIMINGFSMMDSAALPNVGTGIVRFKTWEERPGRERSVAALVQRLQAKFVTFPEANIMFFTPPPITGLGMAGGVNMQLLDKRNQGSLALADAGRQVSYLATVDVREPSGTMVMAIATFDPTSPQLYLTIDRDKHKKMGISFNEVSNTLRTYVGSVYINDFNSFGRVFRVTAMAGGDFRQNAEQILSMKVKNADGEMVPLRSFATIEDRVGPQMLFRHNMYPAMKVTGIVRPDKSSGQAMERMKEICTEMLPEGYGYEWVDITYQEATVGNQTVVMFTLSVAFAFLVLAALYESWSCPLIIMMAVPLGVMGAMIAVFIRGMSGGSSMDINMYTQIGFIVMVGLSAKNAILITEFAKEHREHGETLVQAAYEAGRLRLRPIMMTSFAFILGVLP